MEFELGSVIKNSEPFIIMQHIYQSLQLSPWVTQIDSVQTGCYLTSLSVGEPVFQHDIVVNL